MQAGNVALSPVGLQAVTTKRLVVQAFVSQAPAETKVQAVGAWNAASTALAQARDEQALEQQRRERAQTSRGASTSQASKTSAASA